ncbi:MAG: class F sortase [Dehalococcoidia bacterium]
MELKRFLEQQISRTLEATRRTSSGLARNQDRDRLNFYQSILNAVKGGSLDQPAFESNMGAWVSGRRHNLDLGLQALPEPVFRQEILQEYLRFNPSFTPENAAPLPAVHRDEEQGGSRSRLAGVLLGGLALVVVAAVAFVPLAIVANIAPFADEETAPKTQTNAESPAPTSAEDEVAATEQPDTSGTPAAEPPIPQSDAPIQRLIVDGANIDNSSIISLGLQEDESTFEVPTNATQVAWYGFSGLPGEDGKAPILAAHVDYRGQKGAFFDLVNAAPGTFIYLVMADGTAYKYEVESNRDIAKSVLTWNDLGCDPTECFVADAVTLITCGGNFNPRTRSYNDNVVVRATLVATLRESEIPAQVLNQD